MTIYDTELILARTVAITGTRSTGHRALNEYTALFADYLGPFAEGAHFYIGGARGIDTLSLLWLAGNTAAELTIVVPCTVDQQPAEARQAIVRTRDRISEIVELQAGELTTPAYHARNRWMVDHAEMTIAFPKGNNPTSGTWQTIGYTAKVEKPRLIVPV